jgi:hypothetical protein
MPINPIVPIAIRLQKQKTGGRYRPFLSDEE